MHPPPEAMAHIVAAHLDRVRRAAASIGRYGGDTPVGEDWDLQTAVAHLLSWVREFTREAAFVKGHPNGTVPWTVASGGDYASWNRARLQELSGLSHAERIRGWVAGAEELGRLVKSCTASELENVCDLPWESQRGNVPYLVAAWIQHEIQHLDGLVRDGIELDV